jgi:hypothetical protein
MNDYPTKLVEAFALQALEIFYMMSVSEGITNNDYEGLIENKSSKVNILTFGAISTHNYDGTDMSADDLTESNAQLVTDQAKYVYFTVKTWDKFRSFIKDPENPVARQVASEIKKVIDIYVLGFYGDAGAGNWLGTSETTGTVEIDASGNVTGTSTAFTSSMVGKPFKALGHTEWYRVKTYNSADGATAIVIEDDSDDLTSAYTGGAINSGATFEIQAATAKQVTKNTVFAEFIEMQTRLTNQEVPEEDRWAVVPARIAALIRQAPEYVGEAASEGAREAVMNGALPKRFAGFTVYEVSDARISGDYVNGYHIMAGHRSAITFAMGLTENGVEDAIGNFGKRIKQLYVYGAKVADERRKALVHAFWKL